MTDNTQKAPDQLLHELRKREVQAIGAAISTQSWHGVETAYNQLRDKMDAAGAWHGPDAQSQYQGLIRRLLERDAYDDQGPHDPTTLYGEAAQAIAALSQPPEASEGEAVVTIGKDWRLLWSSQDTLSTIVERTGIKIGDKLYAHPPKASPMQDDPTFKRGDRVEKISGAKWRGTVVGEYSTALTPEGYAVESETETGSVQIYPVKALSLALAQPAPEQGEG